MIGVGRGVAIVGPIIASLLFDGGFGLSLVAFVMALGSLVAFIMLIILGRDRRGQTFCSRQSACVGPTLII